MDLNRGILIISSFEMQQVGNATFKRANLCLYHFLFTRQVRTNKLLTKLITEILSIYNTLDKAILSVMRNTTTKPVFTKTDENSINEMLDRKIYDKECITISRIHKLCFH